FPWGGFRSRSCLTRCCSSSAVATMGSRPHPPARGPEAASCSHNTGFANRGGLCFSIPEVLPMTVARPLVLAFTCLALSALSTRADEPAADSDSAGPVSYYRDVRPIFQQHCQGCHQPARAQGGYVMTSHADLLKETESG